MSLDTTDEEQVIDTADEGAAAALEGAEQVDSDSGDDADLMAGYNFATTGEEPEPAKSPEPEPTPEAKPEPAKIGRWTEEEVEARFADLESLKKGQATVAGHIGDLRNRLAGQKPRTITKDDLKKVAAEFGEEYANALADDLNAVGFGGHAGPSQAEIDKLVDARASQHIAQAKRELAYEAVLEAHEDAADYFVGVDAQGKPVPGKHSAAFRGWIATLSPERQKEIGSAWEARTVKRYLKEFKDLQKPPTASPAPAAAPAAPARNSRVERAVAPRGTGAATPPVEDPFLAGYKQAKGGG